MKKVVVLFLSMMLLFAASTALAYNPGDTVTITVSITSVSASSVAITVDAENDNVLIFQSATKTMPGMGFAPQKDGAAFTVISADMVSPVPTGVVGTVTYKIANNAPAGKYRINVSSSNAVVSGGTTVVIPCKAHNWDDGEILDQPNCLREGRVKYTCTTCGSISYGQTEKLPHDNDTERIVKAATCTKDGLKSLYCSMCSKYQGDAAIPALGHHGVIIPAVLPTEMEPGKTEGKRCSRCDVILVEQSTIPALGYKIYYPGDTVTITVSIASTSAPSVAITVNAENDQVLIFQRATKTMAGMGFAPQKDGAAFTAISSDMVSPVPTGVVGTATYKIANNAPEGKYRISVSCPNASVSGSITVDVAAKKHKWVFQQAQYQPPTCQKDGKIVYTCSDCGQARIESIQRIPHDNNDERIVEAATCTQTGLNSLHCSMCGKHQGNAEIPALGHIQVVKPAVFPTETETGKTEGRTCSRCNAVLADEISIPALGNKKYAPGDTLTLTISVLSADAASARIVVNAANDDVLIFQSATMTMSVLGYAPAKDGAAFTMMSMDAISSIPNGIVGTVTYKIAEDAPVGKYSIDVVAFGNIVVAGGKNVSVVCKEHTWGDSEVQYAPTCEQEGQKKETCVVCGEFRLLPIEALGHDKVVLPGKLPTCTEPGLTEGEQCAICEVVLVAQNEIQPLGHEEGSPVVLVEPTATTEGSQGYPCIRCEEILRTEVIPALGNPGDANDDGIVDIHDALLVYQYVAGWEVNVHPDNADVNIDGRIDSEDALLILRYCAGENVSLR